MNVHQSSIPATLHSPIAKSSLNDEVVKLLQSFKIFLLQRKLVLTPSKPIIKL
ncbi:hypothetical protein Sjap_008583 [Stephania japonica]|uniref:Uncharacterized protein n=1 Tax=Stephania japonica TaxID=461633 RepID=A0AAP0JQG9_9MAGN